MIFTNLFTFRSLKMRFKKTVMFIIVLALLTTVVPVNNIASAANTGSDYWTDYAKKPVLTGSTYLINSASELAWVAVQVNEGATFAGQTVKLANSIDLYDHYWVPIGKQSFTSSIDPGLTEHVSFNGTFNGNDYFIYNLKIRASSGSETERASIGLFGLASDATFKNVGLYDINIYSASYADIGGLVCDGTNITIENCFTTGVLTEHAGRDNQVTSVGGLFCGIDGTVTNCYSTCSVSGDDYAIVGSLGGSFSGTMTCCYATGNASAGDCGTAGGLLGGCSFADISHCYATGSVSCGRDGNTSDVNDPFYSSLTKSFAGGFAGTIDRLSRIEDCYAIGSVSGSSEDTNGNGGIDTFVGGFAGFGSFESTVSNVYWNSDASISGGNLFVFPHYEQGDEVYKVGIRNIDPTYDSGIDEIDPNYDFKTKAPIKVNPTVYTFKDNSIANTASFMKNNEFLSLLNGSGRAVWKLDLGKNNGYPILADIYYSAPSASTSTSQTTSPSAPTDSGKTATPTSANVMVNGSPVKFEAYNIDGSNYFKLRDIAYTLTDTGNRFDVGWDSAKNAIGLSSGISYNEVGGEMALSGSAAAVAANLSTSNIYLDGDAVSLTAYNIGGNNYFKLRDLASAIGFTVSYDESTKTITIVTAANSKPEVTVNTPNSTGYWIDYAVKPAYNSTTDTYTIKTPEELAWLAIPKNYNESYSFELAADIDLAGRDWVPIAATDETGYNYQLNGMGHIINNLTISSGAYKDIKYLYAGLCGTAGYKIWDVNLLNVRISINSSDGPEVSAGALAGYVNGSEISGCSSTGTVSGSALKDAGGLIGNFQEGVVKSSCSECTVLSTQPLSYCGGLCGAAYSENSDTFIRNCHATGKVTAVSAGGGLVGLSWGVIIENCYATGDVVVQYDGGGLIGNVPDTSYYQEDRLLKIKAGSINNCYCTGNVSGVGDSSYTGALLGEVFEINITSCYCKSGSSDAAVGYNPNNIVLDITSLTADYMKSDEFISKLNSYISKDSSLQKWMKDTAKTNSSYPVLDGVWIPTL